MFIKNNSTSPHSAQGVLLVPGQETEIPEHLQESVQRDIKGVDALEVVKAKAKPGPKAKEDEPK